MTESIRNGKWIWLPIVLIIIGISQPLTSYYMPQILEMAGNIPDGATIDIPTPSGEEVLMGTLSQFGMIGTLLFVLAVMSVIAQERQNGSLTLVMVRPISALQYIGSKYVAQLVLLLVAFFLSYGFTWYYTNLLFSDVAWTVIISSFIVYSLWIVFVVAVTIFTGTVVKNNGGIAGASILFLGAISLLTSLLPRFMEWSPGNLRAAASMVLLEGVWSKDVWMVVSCTVALSVLFFALAVWRFKRFESYNG